MKNPNKIYISLPMGGHEKTVKKRYDEAEKYLRCVFGDNIIISGPLNIDEFDENGYIPDRSGKREHPWEFYIGEDIKELLTCGMIFMTRGWTWSPGCKIERAVANAYNIEVIEAKDHLEKL